MNNLLIFFTIFSVTFFICKCSYEITFSPTFQEFFKGKTFMKRMLLNILSSNLEDAFLFALCSNF